jgi:hypothetical protein
VGAVSDGRDDAGQSHSIREPLPNGERPAKSAAAKDGRLFNGRTIAFGGEPEVGRRAGWLLLAPLALRRAWSIQIHRPRSFIPLIPDN